MVQTPLPIPTVRVLSMVVTVGSTVALLMSFPETDNNNRAHVFTAIKRQLSSSITGLTTVDEREAEAIRRIRDRES